MANQSPTRKLEHPALISVLLALVTFCAYFSVARLDFTNFDDPAYVTTNPQVSAGLTWQGVAWAFARGHAANWHPVTWLSHMADCSLFGLNPAGHHLVNLAFHAANGILLFLLLRSLTGHCWRSATVAALFALHPLHVESVAWVAERKDVLSAFWGLLCLWAYARYVKVQEQRSEGRSLDPSFAQHPKSHPRRLGFGYYLLALGFFALGLMSKPMLVTWPCVMLLLDYWPLRRFQLSGFKAQSPMLCRCVLEKMPFFALSVASCVITVLTQKAAGAVALLERVTLTQRVGNALVSYVRYVEKLAWPVDLAAIYPLGEGYALTTILLAGAALMGVTGWATWQRNRRPWFLAGRAWYLGTLVPVIGLVQVGSQSMADRYMYLPAIGLFIILAWGIAEMAGDGRVRRLLVTVSSVGVLTACLMVTQRQVLYWRNTETLFHRALAVTPKNFVACNQLGLYFASQQQMNAAQHWYREALAVRPTHPLAWNNLGCALAGMGKYDEAIADFKTALRFDPAQVNALNGLGTTLLKAGRTEEALPRFQEALRLQPDNAQAHFNLANALVTQGQTAQAIEHYRRALRSEPCWADVYNNLAFLLARAGNLDEAISAFRTALRLQPDLWQAHYGLGETLAADGKPVEAAGEFLMLAAAHGAAGRLGEAVKAARRAEELALTSGRSDLRQSAQQQRERYDQALRGGARQP